MGRGQVDQRGSQRRECRASGYALSDASDEKDRHIARDQKQDEGHCFQHDRRGEDRTAADVIGKSTENEQRADQSDDVDGEDDG